MKLSIPFTALFLAGQSLALPVPLNIHIKLPAGTKLHSVYRLTGKPAGISIGTVPAHPDVQDGPKHVVKTLPELQPKRKSKESVEPKTPQVSKLSKATKESKESQPDSKPRNSKPDVDECGDSPAIIVENKSDHLICYQVELGDKVAPVDGLDAKCGLGSGFTVKVGRTTTFCPGKGFHGALTAFHEQKVGRKVKQIQGSRFEFTFAELGPTYYNVDYEMGMDDSTVAPNIVQAKTQIVGESHIAEKVNAAFQKLSRPEQASMHRTGYLTFKNGQVKDVRMDKAAPDNYVVWLQLEAKLKGYVNPGSVNGEKAARKVRYGDAVKAADSCVRSTMGETLVVTSY